MVTNRKQHSSESRVKQALNEVDPKPNKIGASTPYDFSGKNLTPYGGLLPVATMLEKIGFQKLVEETLTVDRATKAMSTYQFILALAETREFLAGELRNGDRPTGKQIARHLQEVFQALPRCVVSIYGRADSGFYCWEAVEAYEKFKCRFIIVARKTSRLLDELIAAEWKPSPHTDAHQQCEFWYPPKGWGKAYRFLALRYEKDLDDEEESEEVVQYQLFATKQYKYRVFVTNMEGPIDKLVWFYNQRAGAENLIKESNNDAVLAAHPSRLFVTNQNHFHLAMLAYNLNCWLMLFNREATDTTTSLKHTTLATARLRFLFIAAKIWRHAGRTGVSFSDHYEEKGLFRRLMERLRAIQPRGDSFVPVVEGALLYGPRKTRAATRTRDKEEANNNDHIRSAQS